MIFVSGLPETRCGVGATIANTAAVREWLPKLVAELGVKIFLDAPCGDCNWISTVDLGCQYIGVDNDESNLVGPLSAGRDVRCLDIVHDELPHADLLLCRWCLQHLPNEMVHGFLTNFHASGIPWLLATSHRAPTNMDLTRPGDFRSLNLCGEPFNLPVPRQAIEDCGADLALWHRDDLPC